MNTIDKLSECYVEVGKTTEYETAYTKLTDGLTTDEQNEIFFTLAEAVSAEAARAFKAGFDVAVSLLTRGGTA